ncbi:SixA phosphatase family protein [Thiosulfatihalobacter marinus]|uniref:SixA phosphatase family protein n=1 Tax=Thiosulfatihalobacter marinus TaxID=2792481 RepID=UPI0018D8F053|nr:histidine phosphatase family protein [Thiosulfatihalobacter marinus]
MALSLILVRHAKSSWDTPALSDHDRPLNKRGRASARAIGDWLRKENLLPDQILTSTAQRTLETCALMGMGTTPQADRSLYLAGADTMLRALRQASGQCVMLLGHNPGIGEFAERLATALPAHPRFLDYPTGATTLFKFGPDGWKDVAFGSGKVKSFVIPRELLE